LYKSKLTDLSPLAIDEFEHLTHLMEKFELSFNLADTDRYIVPELLPPEEPATASQAVLGEGMLRFEIRYDFMPGCIISRFTNVLQR